LRAAYVYEGAARELVHALKYRGVTAAAEPMAALSAETIRSECLTFDVIVAVPLHGSRQRTRGYNQADLLALRIGAELGMPVLASALQRTRSTPQQARTSDVDERRKNIEQAFAPRPDDVRGRDVLLVDDVTTSGATFAECARVLKEGGAKRVLAFAFARED
jgi:ComF family protein